mmetsp:Transcript_48601/g.150057  ORF Transcript_48601/g.150057 Transcript_48601/m.150057 type:complete len:200 (-) Transcript_48601:420-1019(-)
MAEQMCCTDACLSWLCSTSSTSSCDGTIEKTCRMCPKVRGVMWQFLSTSVCRFFNVTSASPMSTSERSSGIPERSTYVMCAWNFLSMSHTFGTQCSVSFARCWWCAKETLRGTMSSLNCSTSCGTCWSMTWKKSSLMTPTCTLSTSVWLRSTSSRHLSSSSARSIACVNLVIGLRAVPSSALLRWQCSMYVALRYSRRE